MSRIHDALRMAEQSRGREAESGNIDVFAERKPVQNASEDLHIGAVELASGLQEHSTAEGISSELIDARCTGPAWSQDSQRVIFGNGNENTVEHEQFRTLRSRLYQLRAERPLKALLITSPLPGEGKTFVAANLARAIVRDRERRVLLIDADLRHPDLHNLLGVPPEPGLAEYLCGAADELSIIRKDPTSNLSMVPAGTAGNAGELIGNGKLKTLLDMMRPLFDWIIIDSPPTSPVADTALIAQACDGITMVLRANSTPFDLAQRTRDEFRGKAVLGVILNQVVIDNPYCAYYQGVYGKGGVPSVKG